jgi:hypothetical protein
MLAELHMLMAVLVALPLVGLIIAFLAPSDPRKFRKHRRHALSCRQSPGNRAKASRRLWPHGGFQDLRGKPHRPR